MDKPVTLFLVPGRTQNQEAVEKLRSITSLEFEIVNVPEAMEELYPCPFVTDEKNDGYYGLSGIDFFIRQRFASSQEVDYIAGDTKRQATSLPVA
ncbi:MAG: hypothetical protein JOZ57_05140 [Abitibacteriaceae bacterium]|nr:hypothetical protein [Abditibacteriaceae bacterium]